MSRLKIDPMKCERPADMARYLEQQGLHYKRTTGGHDIYGNAHGSIPLCTHGTLGVGLRHKIAKEVLKLLAFGLFVWALWGWAL